jgi:hypothetical protein
MTVIQLLARIPTFPSTCTLYLSYYSYLCSQRPHTQDDGSGPGEADNDPGGTAASLAAGSLVSLLVPLAPPLCAEQYGQAQEPDQGT